MEEEFAGRRVLIHYDVETRLFRVEVPEGIDTVEGFWFAWMALQPESSVFQAGSDD